MSIISIMSMSKKGVVTIIELIMIILILFISFSVFFPPARYEHNWDNAYSALLGKDMMTALVATGDLESFFSDETSMYNFFNTLFPESNLIFWYRMYKVKDDISVACNCTNSQIAQLEDWVTDLRFNNRDITISFCQTSLENSNNCIRNSDEMLIYGYKDLQPYEQLLSDYVMEGNGIIEIVDFSSDPDLDVVQQKIFGISDGGVFNNEENIIIEPYSINDLIYQVHKNFYKIPLSLSTTQTETIGQCPVDAEKGIFKFRGNEYGFWVCQASEIYFDSTGTTNPDIGPYIPDQSFSLGGFDFKLSYIDSSSKIRINFLDSPKYRFENFISSLHREIIQSDGNNDRVFIKIDGFVDNMACGVILNNASDSRTAWVADFGGGGAGMVGDDHRHLMISLLVWASDKQTTSGYIPELEKGYTSSYITVKNIDMLEINQYEIGVGYPY